nr:CBL-interacting serine/threonine-protein kinase [Cedratvirus borely]
MFALGIKTGMEKKFVDTVFSHTSELVFLRTFEDGSKCVVKLLEQNKQRQGQEYRIMKALCERTTIRVPKVIKHSQIEFLHEGKLYSEMIVMDYIPGSPIGVDMCYSKEEARSIALQAIDLVQAIHEAGFMHGDLRPQNFIWDGENLTLIDFGRSYEIEFHHNVKRETFQPGHEHVKTLCVEVPHPAFIRDNWETHSTPTYEYKALSRCLKHIVGKDLYKEFGASFDKFREEVLLL